MRLINVELLFYQQSCFKVFIAFRFSDESWSLMMCYTLVINVILRAVELAFDLILQITEDMLKISNVHKTRRIGNSSHTDSETNLLSKSEYDCMKTSETKTDDEWTEARCD